MNRLSFFLLERAVIAIATLFIVSLLMTVGLELLPGDVAEAILGPEVTPQTLALLRAELGLDRPLITRYVEWLTNVFHGDLGRSLSNSVPVYELLSDRLGNSLVLAGATATITVPVAISLGLLSALYRDSALDRLISGVTLTIVSIPTFLIGYVLILVFAVKLGLLPPISLVPDGGGLGAWAEALVLPVVTLALVAMAHMMRLTRTAVISVLESDYIQMAKLKGLSQSRILIIHAFPNALSPILSIIMLTIAYLIVGTVVVEVVFNYSGVGKLMVDAVAYRDIPLVQGCVLVFCLVYVTLNLAAELLAIISNPRLRYAR